MGQPNQQSGGGERQWRRLKMFKLHRTSIRLTLSNEVLSVAVPLLSASQSPVPSSVAPDTGLQRRLRQFADRVVQARQNGEDNQMRSEPNQAVGSAS